MSRSRMILVCHVDGYSVYEEIFVYPHYFKNGAGFNRIVTQVRAQSPRGNFIVRINHKHGYHSTCVYSRGVPKK